MLGRIRVPRMREVIWWHAAVAVLFTIIAVLLITELNVPCGRIWLESLWLYSFDATAFNFSSQTWLNNATGQVDCDAFLEHGCDLDESDAIELLKIRSGSYAITKLSPAAGVRLSRGDYHLERCFKQDEFCNSPAAALWCADTSLCVELCERFRNGVTYEFSSGKDRLNLQISCPHFSPFSAFMTDYVVSRGNLQPFLNGTAVPTRLSISDVAQTRRQFHTVGANCFDMSWACKTLAGSGFVLTPNHTLFECGGKSSGSGDTVLVLDCSDAHVEASAVGYYDTTFSHTLADSPVYRDSFVLGGTSKYFIFSSLSLVSTLSAAVGVVAVFVLQRVYRKKMRKVALEYTVLAPATAVRAEAAADPASDTENPYGTADYLVTESAPSEGESALTKDEATTSGDTLEDTVINEPAEAVGARPGIPLGSGATQAQLRNILHQLSSIRNTYTQEIEHFLQVISFTLGGIIVNGVFSGICYFSVIRGGLFTVKATGLDLVIARIDAASNVLFFLMWVATRVLVLVATFCTSRYHNVRRF